MFQSAAVQERARRIVDCAVALAEKGGFEAVRLRDVAAESGVALGTLYRHFRSKEDLLVAALAGEIEQLEARMASHPAAGRTALDRVSSFFTTATHALCRRPNVAKAVLRATASGQPELTEKVASFHGRMTALITAAVRGPTPSDGSDGHQPTASETSAGLVLQQVWFAALVGWGGGLHDEDMVIDQVRAAADLILAP